VNIISSSVNNFFVFISFVFVVLNFICFLFCLNQDFQDYLIFSFLTYFKIPVILLILLILILTINSRPKGKKYFFNKMPNVYEHRAKSFKQGLNSV